MSPNKLQVTITSNCASGSRTISIASVSIYRCLGLDLGIFLPHFLEHPLPQVMRKRHGIRLIAHANALQAILPGIVKRIADDALHTLARVDVLLHRQSRPQCLS